MYPRFSRVASLGVVLAAAVVARSEDLARILPPGALAYLEVHQPGQHLARVLEAARLVGRAGDASQASPFVVSPRLLEALKAVEGAAVAVTDFNLRQGIPQGVVVLDPGRSDLVYGLVETALSGASASGEIRVGEPLAGQPTFETPVGLVVLTEKLIVLGSSRELAAAAIERSRSQDGTSFVGPDAELRKLWEEGQGSLVRVVVDGRALVEGVKAEAFHGEEPPEEYRMVQGLIDPESLRWLSLTLGAQERSLTLEARFGLAPENNAFAYHVLRTPPVSREALRAAPAGAAAILALGVGDPAAGPTPPRDTAGEAPVQITGLDLGRELFANVKEVVAFALPWGEDGPRGKNAPIPDAGVVFTVRDPARSEALWKQLLGLGSLLARSGRDAIRKEQQGGQTVHVYSFPGGIEVRVLRLEDRVIVGSSARALATAVASREPRGSALEDGALAAGWARAGEGASKLLLVHVGRLLELLAPVGGLQGEEAALAAEALRDAAVTLATREDPAALRLVLKADVPRLDEVLRAVFARSVAARTSRPAPQPAADRGPPRKPARPGREKKI